MMEQTGAVVGALKAAVERRACRCGACVVARRAEEPLVLARVETNMDLAWLSSDRARQAGAAYSCGVHDGPPGSA